MSYESYEKWKTTPIEGEPYVSIVIPAYNESERIIPTIGAIASHVSDLGFDWELLVADDGSKDNTVALLNDLNLANLHVLEAPKNGGKGSAVRRGMLAAKGKYVLFTDADNSTPIENISKMLKKFEEGYDVVIGSRGADGASESNKSFLRHLLSGGLRFLVRFVLNIHVSDTQCGFKMYTREAAHVLHQAQTIDGFSFDLEVLYLAAKQNYKIAEVPVDWMDSPGSTVDTKKEAIRFLKDMTRIRWQNLKGVYKKRLESAKASATANRPLTLALVSPYPPSKTSLNEYAYHFVDALRQKSEVGQIYILADELPAGETYPTFSGDGVPTTIIPCWKFDAWNNAMRIQTAIKTLRPDVVLYNIQFASFGGSRIPAALGLLSPMMIKRFARMPTIVLLHNIMETIDLANAGFESGSLMDFVTRKAGEIMTRMLLATDLVALTIPKYIEILQDKYDAENVFLAPHGAFDELPEPTFSDSNDGTLKIMTFGKFGTYKKVEILIEAFAKLQARSTNPLELEIAGSDSPNAAGYLENVRAKYAHVKRIKFTGYVAEEDVAPTFLSSDVVVFPYTSTTGSSGVLHQAGGYGRAVVLPNLGDFAELIHEEGYTGEFFTPDSVDSLASAIDTLLRDPQLRKTQGQQNFLAARGLPVADVVDWYLMHIARLQRHDISQTIQPQFTQQTQKQAI